MITDAELDREIAALEARREKLAKAKELKRQIAGMSGPEAHDAINRIVKIVCELRGVNDVVLFSRLKTNQVAEARFMAWFVIRKTLRLSSTQMGLLFSRDHAAILNGCRRCAEIMAIDASYAADVATVERLYLKGQNT